MMYARGRLGWLVFVTVCTAGIGSVRGDTGWTGVLTQQALSGGYQAKLPPHVSVVLGLTSKGESVPVRQLLSRGADKVRTFNVSVANHRDVVLFVVDERAQSTVAYLIAPGGKLRKAVAYQIGGDPHELTASEARPGLAREIRHWSDYAAGSKAAPAPSPASAPNPANAPKPEEAPKPVDAPQPASSPTL